MRDGIPVHLVIASPTTIGKPLIPSDGSITSPVATIPDFGAGGRGDRRGSARQAELLPVPYYHLVFTLPAAITRIPYQNKAQVYGILFVGHFRGFGIN
jgi:hypothetical protein